MKQMYKDSEQLSFI